MRLGGIRKPALLLPITLLFYTALIITTFSMIFYARDRFQASAAVIGWLAAVPHLCYFGGCFALDGRPVSCPRFFEPRNPALQIDRCSLPLDGLMGAFRSQASRAVFTGVGRHAGPLRCMTAQFLLLFNKVHGNAPPRQEGCRIQSGNPAV